MPLVAVLDTNVLFPPTLRDTLLYAADAGLFDPHWSVETVSELRRNLVLKAHLSDEQASRRIEHMRLAFPKAEIQAPLRDVPSLPDPNDRHVLAAALAAEAGVIVSSNTRDFPTDILAPLRIAVVTPDEFLCRLLRDSGPILASTLLWHASLLRQPPTTVTGLLRSLSAHAPRFVRLVLESGLLGP